MASYRARTGVKPLGYDWYVEEQASGCFWLIRVLEGFVIGERFELQGIFETAEEARAAGRAQLGGRPRPEIAPRGLLITDWLSRWQRTAER